MRVWLSAARVAGSPQYVVASSNLIALRLGFMQSFSCGLGQIMRWWHHAGTTIFAMDGSPSSALTKSGCRLSTAERAACSSWAYACGRRMVERQMKYA